MKKCVFAFVFLLSGCASTQPLNFTPAAVLPAGTKLDAALMNVTVAMNSTKGDTGKKRRIDAGGFETELQTLWKSSLEDSLTRSAIFNDDSHRRVNLSVRIEKLALPSGAVVMHTGTVARYELLDRATGRAIFSTDIESDGRVDGSYAFMGATRARESVNRSIQNNITQFIEKLKAAQLSPQ